MKSDIPYIDTDTPEFYSDPNSVLIRGAERLDLVRSPYGIEVMNYKLVRGIFREPRFVPRRAQYFRDAGATPPVMDFIRHGAFNFMEPVDHDRVRTIMFNGFRPGRVEPARAMMRSTAHTLVDQFANTFESDLVADFTHFYPLAVLARFIGADPDEVELLNGPSVSLRLLGQRPLEPHLPALEAALETLVGHARELVSARRISPREDFISEMLARQSDVVGEEGTLTDAEITWGVVFLILAGHDTTRFTLASCLTLLITSGKWDEIDADPALVPRAIVEAMRLRPGTPRQVRVVDEDLEYGGYQFEKGDVLALNFVGAGRDPESFSEPDEFDLERPTPLYNTGFGLGRHSCTGSHIARAEMEEGIKVLTNRLTGVAIVGDIPLKTGGIIGGFDAVPVTFTIRDDVKVTA